MRQLFKKGSKWRTSSPAYPFLWFIQKFKVETRSTSPDMTTAFHTWAYGRFIEIQSNLRRKKLHRTNHISNSLGGSFNNRDNVRAPIPFRNDSQPMHLKRLFFLMRRSIHVQINSTSVFRLVKTKLVEFLQRWNQQATSCPSPHSLVGQVQV